MPRQDTLLYFHYISHNLKTKNLYSSYILNIKALSTMVMAMLSLYLPNSLIIM